MLGFGKKKTIPDAPLSTPVSTQANASGVSSNVANNQIQTNKEAPITRKAIEKEMNATQEHWEGNVSLFRLYVLASRINLVLIVYSAVATFATVWVETHPQLPTYFATSETGHIVPLVPLNVPYITDHTVIAWAMQKIPDALSLSALNYRRDLQRARPYFTENGFEGFLKGLNAHGELKAIRERNLMVSTIPTGPGVVVWQGRLPNGIYAWRVQFPLKMIYRSSSQISEHKYDANVLVQRAVTLKNPAAISIQSFYLGEQKK